MKISLNWLKDWGTFKVSEEEVISKISHSTSEVEEIVKQWEGLEKVFVGQILKIEKHPDADKMQITQTKVWDTTYQIVCGAKNIKEWQKVAVALVWAMLPWGFEIKQAMKRWVESNGMICAKQEMWLEEKSEWILVLSEDAKSWMPIKEYLNLNDTIIEIENTTITNRPDLFSHIWYIRELMALGIFELNNKNLLPEIIKTKWKFPLNIKIENKDIIPRLCGVMIKNFKVKESKQYIIDRLEACWIRSINNIVDITNYVMLELWMPLHAFDLDMIEGSNIELWLSKQGEKMTTLDTIERELQKNIIVLKDEKKIFDLCWIMWGANSEIKNSSTNIWVHAPIYNPTLIRRASIALNHRTDASVVYEKSVPTDMALYWLMRALELMKEACPAMEINSEILDIDNTDEKTRIVELRHNKLEIIIGHKIEENFVKETLESMWFTLSISNDVYTINIPNFRFKDIEIEADLIEEIARIYWLENIKEELPAIKMQLSEHINEYGIEKQTKDILSKTAYEVLNYSFLSKSLLDKCEMFNDNLIEVMNPLSEETRFMRPSLVPHLLSNIQLNHKQENSFNLFEIGKVFTKDDNSSKETIHLSYASYNSDFYKTKSVLENLFNKLNLKIDLKETENWSNIEHPWQSAQIIFRGKNIGTIASIHPKILKKIGLNKQITFFEINFQTVLHVKIKPIKIKPYNKLPISERDQNFILNKKILVWDFIKKISKKIPNLIDLSIIDIYQWEHIENNKKSVTVRAKYQSIEKTMTDEEVNNSHKNLIETAWKNWAELR